MRKILVVASVLALSVCMVSMAFAQGKKGGTRFAKKGTIVASGEVGYESKTQEYDGKETSSSTELNFAPVVGYFVTDGLAISVFPGYMKSTDKPKGGDEAETSAVALGVDARYYYLLQGTTFLNAGVSAAYLSGTGEGDVDFSGRDIKISVGGTLSFGKKWGGFASLDIGYDMQTTKADTEGAKDSSDNGIVLESAIGIFF